jgi:cold shock CspA family protein
MSSTQSESKRFIGQVKWFNNRAGYGFITMTDESGTEKDVFTHYSTIKMEQSQYKYLVQGEYVEFELTTSTNKGHEFQATNVTGIKGGSLMCETRQQNRIQAPRVQQESRTPRTNYRRGPRREPREPRSNEPEKDEDGFEKVRSKRGPKELNNEPTTEPPSNTPA